MYIFVFLFTLSVISFPGLTLDGICLKSFYQTDPCCSFRLTWVYWACWDSAYPLTCCAPASASSISETNRRWSMSRSTTPPSGRWRHITSARCFQMPGEAPQTFSYLAVTHRDNSKQPSPSVPQWCTDDGRRIQAGLGSSSLTFIFYCYSLVCLLMTGAARQSPAALCWFRNESRKVFWILIYETFVVCLCFQDVQFNSLINTNIHCFRTK